LFPHLYSEAPARQKVANPKDHIAFRPLAQQREHHRCSRK
jgi:hypothetical protein